MKTSRLLCLCVLTLLMGLFSTAQAADALKSIKVLTNHTFIGKYAPLFVGVKQGFYQDAGFKLDVIPTGGSGYVMSAIDGNKADFGIADVGSALEAMAKGSRARGFFVYMDRSAVGLASLTAYADLTSLEDTRIAANQADSARAVLPILLADHDLEDMPYTWVSADPNVYFSLLLSGKVDLVSSSLDGDVPALERIAEPRGKEVHFLSFYDLGYDVYGLWLVANKHKLSDHPDEVERFAHATRKAFLYAIKHPHATAQALVDQHPTLDYDTILKQWQQSIKSMGDEPLEHTDYGLAESKRLQRTIDFMQQVMDFDGHKMAPDAVFDNVLAN